VIILAGRMVWTHPENAYSRLGHRQRIEKIKESETFWRENVAGFWVTRRLMNSVIGNFFHILGFSTVCRLFVPVNKQVWWQTVILYHFVKKNYLFDFSFWVKLVFYSLFLFLILNWFSNFVKF